MIPAEWPDGMFDLIVLSEVLYYLDAAANLATARRAAAALRPGAVAWSWCTTSGDRLPRDR